MNSVYKIEFMDGSVEYFHSLKYNIYYKNLQNKETLKYDSSYLGTKPGGVIQSYNKAIAYVNKFDKDINYNGFRL